MQPLRALSQQSFDMRPQHANKRPLRSDSRDDGVKRLAGSEGFEQRMLMLDFELMKAYYGLASLLSRSKARRALQEMTQVVCYFANAMGERGGWTSVTE